MPIDSQHTSMTQVRHSHIGMHTPSPPKVITSSLLNKLSNQLTSNHILAIKNYFELLNCSNDIVPSSCSTVQGKQSLSPKRKPMGPNNLVDTTHRSLLLHTYVTDPPQTPNNNHNPSLQTARVNSHPIATEVPPKSATSWPPPFPSNHSIPCMHVPNPTPSPQGTSITHKNLPLPTSHPTPTKIPY